MTQETGPDAPAAAPQERAPDDARPGRPRRRRAPKPDPLLVADVATARAAVEQIAEPGRIGEGHRVQVEEDRLVTHLFECTLPGYRGWNWFASLARAPRSKTVTVCEVGLLPGENALLAPEWLPWSDRVSPEEKALEDLDQDGADPDSADPGSADPDGADPDSTAEAAAEPAAGSPAGLPATGTGEEAAEAPEGDRP